MTDPDRLDQPGPQECSDLEYDLAHEAAGSTTGGADPAAAKPPERTYVATETADYDEGDYGYDLAHDIPKA